MQWDAISSIALHLIGIFFLVLLNGFFVAAEFALVKVRASQLDPLIEEGNKSANIAKHVLGHMDSYLSATQFGVTVTSLVLGAIGEPYMERLLEPLFVALGVQSTAIIKGAGWGLGLTFITFLHIIIGELAPKYLSIRHPLRMALVLVRPLQLFVTVFKPFIWLLNMSANLILRRLFRISPVGEGNLRTARKSCASSSPRARVQMKFRRLGRSCSSTHSISKIVSCATSPRRAARSCF